MTNLRYAAQMPPEREAINHPGSRHIAAPHADRPHPGLSSEEARRRREVYGPNSLPEPEPALWRQILAKFWAPVPWMLEAAILLQFMLREYIEAAVIATLLVLNAVLGLVQEGRAQATLRALKSRLALLTTVRRDGAWKILPVTELVTGDLVKLTLGGVVPADVQLVEGDVLLDQSMLTGESLPVEAGAGAQTYAGALVRRGAALAEVAATGVHTKFGKTLQLVGIAHAPSSQVQAVLRVVRNLAGFSAAMVVVQLLYATLTGMPALEVIPLVLTAVLAAIPVALPATFTLAAAVSARALAARNVLPTRLSAIDEAATIDVLCSDKTGTLTQNALVVTAVHGSPGNDEARVLALAALASADHSMDPVDAAVRAAAARATIGEPMALTRFVPFDPALRTSGAEVVDGHGQSLRILKGAFATIAAVASPPAGVEAGATALANLGNRVLGVAAGPTGQLAYVGFIALSDPPRPDARGLIAELRSLGVETVMVTGDAAPTAAVAARAVGLEGAVSSGKPPKLARAEEYSVFAGVFPEDKFDIVRAFQSAGHAVGMCGDGANDAPALRQAQMGIAVSTATDIAKSAAGIVLTEPGLNGIVEAVRCGRATYQRILTYVLRSLTAKVNQMLFLTIGLIVTGHAILTPVLVVILVISGDFLAMSATTDRVRLSNRPNAWHVGRIMVGAIVLGVCNAAFCTAVLVVAVHGLGLEVDHGLRTLAAIALVFSTQAAFYVVRDRRHLWSSQPSAWILLSSGLDISIIAILAGRGYLMHALPWPLILGVLIAAALFALVLDAAKSVVFTRLGLAS